VQDPQLFAGYDLTPESFQKDNKDFVVNKGNVDTTDSSLENITSRRLPAHHGHHSHQSEHEKHGHHSHQGHQGQDI
jgi:hypothetical protein